MDGVLEKLTSNFSSTGEVTWIGLRPARKAAMISMQKVLIAETGLEGDRRETPGKRAITLIQHEHLPVIAALCGKDSVSPDLLRRNIVVSGINLLGLRNRNFKIGDAVLKGTGLCAPCSRMEEALGHGGYTAMRGHGGITASVAEEGWVELKSKVTPELK